MAFINEYISDEDVEKYNLKELIDKYKRYTYSPRLDNISWTVDKENDIWLIWFGREHDPEMDHGFTREHIFVLYYKGQLIEARLWLEEDSQTNIYQTPFIKKWKLLSLSPRHFDNIDIQKLKDILCKSLSIYGHKGIKKPIDIDNVIVECNFGECCNE